MAVVSSRSDPNRATPLMTNREYFKHARPNEKGYTHATKILALINIIRIEIWNPSS